MGTSRPLPAEYEHFFRAIGRRIRRYRVARKLTQQDMVSFGFSLRHWQMIEAGRPITIVTLLRVCEAFEISPEELASGLAPQHPSRKRRPGGRETQG